MDEADPRAKLEPFQALIGQWTIEMTHPTVEDTVVRGQATYGWLEGGGFLSSVRSTTIPMDHASDVPPLNQPPLKGDLAYGIGLGKDHGWIGHNGEIPRYNTYLFYHPELDAVVVMEVNSDTSSGKCPEDVSTMNEWPRAIPCELPADRIFEALAEALGKPSPSPPAQ
jgi:CubicO group peptidase (beta-lactamase class C family)